MTGKLTTAVRFATGRYTPFLSLFWDEADRDAVAEWLGGAPLDGAAARLEADVLNSLGGDYFVRAFNSGRSAIQAALQAMALPAGSEVLVPTFSCTGLVMPVIQAGLTPVFVDVDEDMNARLDSVVEGSSSRVSAVIVSHLSGTWANDLDGIIEWAKPRGIRVIDDAAQAQGLVRNQRIAGALGDIGVFSSGLGKMSFGPGGGWVVTRDPDLAKSLRAQAVVTEPRRAIDAALSKFALRYGGSAAQQGRTRVEEVISRRVNQRLGLVHAEAGTNEFRFDSSAINNIYARLASLQLKKLHVIIEKRRMFAERWRVALDGLGLVTARVPRIADAVRCKMLLTFAGEKGAAESKQLAGVLWNHGVEVEPSYVPLHLRHQFAGFRKTSMAVTDRLWRGAFALPVRPNLVADDWARIDAALSALHRRLQAC